MTTNDPVLGDVERLLEPILDRIGANLYDLERSGGVLRVTVDRPGGIDLDVLTEVNRSLGRALDDADPIPSKYTLEVSSPGLERSLRTVAHWERAVGERVKVKLHPEGDGPRRAEGIVAGVAGGVVTVTDDDGSATSFTTDAVERARTVFEWGPQPKPGGPKAAKPRKAPTPQGAAQDAPQHEGTATAERAPQDTEDHR
jgi:ribosome maturation factor RimP